jgi:hypothetical protein
MSDHPANRVDTACRERQVATSALTPGPHHVELASGRFLDVSDPDPSSICLDDVAWGLSHTCRFAGQCAEFYSVAEHALLVATRLESLGYDRAVCLAGLHHDDAEAFVGDVTQPLKSLLADYQKIEASVLAAIVEALDLVELPLEHPAVKDADSWALANEAYWLMPSRGATWWTAELRTGSVFWPLGMRPRVARAAWLRKHRALLEGGATGGR